MRCTLKAAILNLVEGYKPQGKNGIISGSCPNNYNSLCRQFYPFLPIISIQNESKSVQTLN